MVLNKKFPPKSQEGTTAAPDFNYVFINYLISFTVLLGGRELLIFPTFSFSVTTSVYRNRLQRILNFTLSLFSFILTDLASARWVFRRKSLILSTCRGIVV
ncbi:uncharacterized protein DEA37_0002374 [Paragonimus westermani]|uniref:Uncharacterized protein n=1 Tax=Paragonimus westermani TaxID=34504 RepID=A0A5J4N851_9TREM|nr:uncharacterized protein DEA37_0002374 [Paragonimus westermani]